MTIPSPTRAAFDACREALMDKIAAGDRLLRPFRIMPKIEALYDPAWEEEWLQLCVYYNCAGRTRPSKTFGQLITLRKLCIDQGRAPDFDTFLARVNSLMYPDALTFHGYSNTFATQDTKGVAKSMGGVLRPLEALGLPVFLYAGALLGLVRDGRYIAHDDDIDLGVYLGDCTDEEAAQKWQDYKVQLCKAGLVAFGPTSNNPAVFKLINDHGITVDLFPAWSTEGKFSVYPYSYHAIDLGDVMPLQFDLERSSEMFDDYAIALPQKPEILLRQSYGKNWLVPDPLFRFDWKSAKKKFYLICTQTYC